MLTKQEVEKIISEVSREGIQEIVSKVVEYQNYDAVLAETVAMNDKENEKGKKKIDECFYNCKESGCNFEELLSWISAYENSFLTEMMNNETKNMMAEAICNKINENRDVINPRDHKGFYFHHLKKPILLLKNSENSDSSHKDFRIPTIDVEKLAFYSEKVVRKNAMEALMNKWCGGYTWQENCINAFAATLGISSLLLAVKRRKGSMTNPLFFTALSVGMFGINWYGHHYQDKTSIKGKR